MRNVLETFGIHSDLAVGDFLGVARNYRQYDNAVRRDKCSDLELRKLK